MLSSVIQSTWNDVVVSQPDLTSQSMKVSPIWPDGITTSNDADGICSAPLSGTESVLSRGRDHCLGRRRRGTYPNVRYLYSGAHRAKLDVSRRVRF